jgi:hypothetical protein
MVQIRLPLFVRGGLYVLGTLTLLVAGAAWAAPSVPLLLLLRSTETEFAWDEIRHAAPQFEGQGGGQLVALRGAKEYFSGVGGPTFYVGREGAFVGRVLLVNLSPKKIQLRLRAFLNYRPVSLMGEDEASPGGTPLRLEAGEERVLAVELANLPSAINDLVFTLTGPDDLHAQTAKGEAQLFLPRRIYHYQLVAERAPREASFASALNRDAVPDCQREERQLLRRDNKVAVVNCETEPATGVFFGQGDPVFYQVPAKAVAVFPQLAAGELFHVSSPHDPADDRLGTPTFIQANFLGL